MYDIAHHLCRELGSERVIEPSSERLADYGRDESYLGVYMPACAVLCDDREQVASVLSIAAEHRIPVTPRGAGSGKTGGCLPVRGGVVLSTERMNRIVDIDADDLVVVTEPGVITGELQQAVEAEGLFYPPDPASLAYCSIGGNVAANAGGPRAFKYGVTRAYVLGVEVGLMGGELLRTGRRTAKGVTGYDVTGGFVGSEGTFGVITDITLKLLPKPAGVATLLAVFADMPAAAAAVSAVIRRGVVARTLEIIDKTSIDHVRPHARYRFPTDAGALLLLEIDGDADALSATMERIGQTCEQSGAIDVLVARDEVQRRDLWEARRILSTSLKRAHPYKVSEDICVPRGALTEMLRRINDLSAQFEVPIATYGHAGDGNLHVNLLVDQNPWHTETNGGARSDTALRVEAAVEALFRHTVALRGTLSGEHGIGLAKKQYMPLEQSERLLEWQRQWKRMWDPLELLNPGKILPARHTGCHE